MLSEDRTEGDGVFVESSTVLDTEPPSGDDLTVGLRPVIAACETGKDGISFIVRSVN